MNLYVLKEAMLDCSNCSKQLFYVTTRDICVSTFFLIQSQLSACCLISASNNYLTKGFRFQPFTVTFIYYSLRLIKITGYQDLNRGCLVYMFSLRFSGSKCLISLRRQFRVRNIFSGAYVFPAFAVFSFCV